MMLRVERNVSQENYLTAQSLLFSIFEFKAAADDELLSALKCAEPTTPQEIFGNALRVYNHAHTVDRIFMANLRGEDHGFRASWTPALPHLADLASQIKRVNAWYLDYIARLFERDLAEMLTFTFTDGGLGCMSREEMLAHVALHAGYHRGEVGRLVPAVEAAGMRDVFAGYLHRTQPARRDAPADLNAPDIS